MTPPAPGGQEEARPERFSRDHLTTMTFDKRFLEQYDRFRDARPKLCLGSRPNGFEWAMRQVWAQYGWDPELGDVPATSMGRLAEAEGEWRNPIKKKR